jgi:FOG: CBS domain
MVKKDDPILVSPTATIKEALKQLDLSARRALLVADADGVFRGVLTDGDIRRAILSGKNLDEGIDEVYNKSPKALYEEEYDDETAKRLFLHHHFDLIPILGQKPDNSAIRFMVGVLFGERGGRGKSRRAVPRIPLGDNGRRKRHQNGAIH